VRKRKVAQDKYDKTWSPSPNSNINDNLPYSINSNVSAFIREQVEGYCNEANLHLLGALSTIKTIDSARLAKPIEEVQEETSRKLQLKKKQFLNDLHNMLSDPDILKTKSSKPISREKSDSISNISNNQSSDPSIDLPSLVEWGFIDDKGNYFPYDHRTNNMIEKEYQKEKKGSIRLTHGFFGSSPQGYLVDFDTMKQIKVESGSERSVQRKNNYIKIDEHKRKMSELEEKIKRLEQTIQTIQPPPATLGQILQNSTAGSKKKTVIYN